MKKSLYLIVALICASGVCHAQSSLPFWLPANGLVAWYPFDGNAIDSSGNNNNGIVYNATLTSDKYGHANNAYAFNGTSSYIYIAPSSTLDIKGSISIAAWVKFNPAAVTSNKQIFWRGDAQFANDPYSLSVNNSYSFRRDAPYLNTVTTPFNQDSSFHFVTGIYDSVSSSYFLYIDGVLANTQVSAGNMTYTTSQMWNMIGSVDNGNDQNFKGVIDDIAVYNRVLTTCEIQRLFLQNAAIITSQPQNISVAAGANVQFSINVQGNSLSYTWQQNSGAGYVNLSNAGAYSGVHTNTLSISNVSLAMNNYNYRCIVADNSGNVCADTSATAKLSVSPTAITGPGSITGVKVWPVPATDHISVEMPDNINTSYLIVNTLGQTVCNAALKGTTTNISVDALPAGCYWLKIKGMPGVQKFVKE